MYTEQQIVENIKCWIEKVIIGLNFCTFAKKDYVNNRVHYQVDNGKHLDATLDQLGVEFKRLDNDPNIATTLFILPRHFNDFYRYLDLLDLANEMGYISWLAFTLIIVLTT